MMMPLSIVLAMVQVLGLAPAAAPVGGGCITAVSLSPSAAEGDAQVFEARYAHCDGAAAFRVVQLWVGDEVTPSAARLNLGFEAGAFFLEDGGACAPADPVALGSTYGSLDCSASSVVQSGDELIVRWALAFDVDTFAGTHGVFFDAKGGTGDPEPRLEWTQMGTFTVTAADATTGAIDDSGLDTSGAVDDTTAAVATTDSGPATTGTGTSATSDDGGLPGAAPHRSAGGPGCGCNGAAPASWTLILIAAVGLRRARRCR